MLHIMISVLAAIGLFGAFCSREKGCRGAMFAYYTNLSNLLAGFYSLSQCLTGGYDMPALHLAVATDIALTMLIYAFVLSPEYRKKQREGKPIDTHRPDTYILHYAVPLLCILEWLLFSSGAALPLHTIPVVLVFQAIYCAFILLRAKKRGNLPGRHTPYPYAFMNPQKLGPARIARNFTAVGALLLLLAAGFVWMQSFVSNFLSQIFTYCTRHVFTLPLSLHRIT